MAMFECPECGKEISSKASICIGCGSPVTVTPRIEVSVYVLINNIETGPLTLPQVKDLLIMRTIDWKTLYAIPGMREWMPLENIRDAIEKAGLPQGYQKVDKASLVFLACVLLLTAVVLLGNFHIISGKDVGLKIVARDSFGFSEMFINMDAIAGMPWISAKSLHPIGVNVLQREKLLESDEDRSQRFKEKFRY